MGGQAAPQQAQVQKRDGTPGTGQEQAAPSGMRAQLRGMDFDAQVAALQPPAEGGGPPVQLMPAQGAPVQREESDKADDKDAKPMPATPKQAVALKDSGIEWANPEIRKHYKSLTDGIPAQNDGWVKQGVSAEERAQRAFEIRHNARLTCRAMMGSRFEVIMLQIRDWWEYSSKDGPDFAFLVKKAKAKGLEGDAIYEEIVGSANRTNKKVDKAMGVDKDQGEK